MAKFKIKPDPTFTGEVAIPRVGGEPTVAPFVFKYLDREELAALFQEWDKQTQSISDKYLSKKLDLKSYTSASVDMQVKQLKQILAGWEFDDEFNDANIRELVNSAVSVPSAIIQHYQEAFQRAKTGN